MLQEMFDFSQNDALTGFRLHSLEILNWGTFDRHVWTFPLGGENALLTGDIGSGKSTAVDALTTLLVPSQQITYNKAAGAEGKERSLTSYVRGYYKSEKDDLNTKGKAVSLRDKNSYSVLLAYFYNEGFAQGVTLAQVFWMTESQNQPERLFIVADEELAIVRDLSGFGSEINDLRKRLKKREGVHLFSTFKEYSSEFRRRLGINNPQALELFYQTVSLKSVGNLTDFVRGHMLNPPDTQQKIEDLCRDFDNLNRSHEAILKAKAQIEALTPLVDGLDRHAILERKHEEWTGCRDALKSYFAKQKMALLSERLEKERLELQKLRDHQQEHDEGLRFLENRSESLRSSIDDQGGRRLKEIARDVERLQRELLAKQQLAESYRGACESLGLPFPRQSDDFYENQARAAQLEAGLDQERQGLDQQRIDLGIALNHLGARQREIEAELQSLRARRSNIPLASLKLRENLCRTLDIPEEALPFVGELVRVREGEEAWEGAVERLLHGFGLSLLVPEKLYSQVAHYVDCTHLHTRLIYFRVRERDLTRSSTRELEALSLVHKLQLHPDSPLVPWLEFELAERFDYACVPDLEAFYKYPRAMTRQGQIKAGSTRHEKDDRHALGDRSRYVLGWSNQGKIQALAAQYSHNAAEISRLETQRAELSRQLKIREVRRDHLRDLARIQDYYAIHWDPIAGDITDLEQEKRQLEAASETLKTLQEQLQGVRERIRGARERRDKLLGDSGKLEERIAENEKSLRDADEAFLSQPEDLRKHFFPLLEQRQPEALPEKRITVENCQRSEQDMRGWLQNHIDRDARTLKDLGERIRLQMQQYKHRYPLETREVDDSLEAGPEFRKMLQKLTQEDLPRHEREFKQWLTERTINGIVSLSNWLQIEQQAIQDKINIINRSLRAIEYNAGTYIELVYDRTPDPEIRQFQQDLRACMSDTLDAQESELYSEQKFLQVKKIIDRFNGREGLTEVDKRWTKVVTDARNWFLFSAMERWIEDDKEKEFYSDSAGKSGGQKEKLAYTILASALAYQFGLEWGEVRSRSFRFVMIDEAFGRGSDDSARFGLEIFKRLNLQILIVTPLQKLHIIEEYVKSVHYIHNEGGRNSVVHNLTMEEYQGGKSFQQAIER